MKIPKERAHDTLLQALMEDPEGADDFVRRAMSKSQRDRLSDKKLRLRGTFVDRQFKRGQRYWVLDAQKTDGAPCAILVLRKSYPDPGTPAQIVRYSMEILDHYRAKGRMFLPTVIPLVIYHGEKPWNIPTELPVAVHGIVMSNPEQDRDGSDQDPDPHWD